MKNSVDKILKDSPDPLDVRKTTAQVFNNLKFIEIDFGKIEDIAKVVKEKVDKKQVLTEEQFGSLNPTPQLIFVLDTINFCFWAGKNEEKWTVEYPKGNFISNGWFALVASIERARKKGFPILDAKFLKNLTLKDAKQIFKSSNSKDIPLLDKRVKFLNEAGNVLLKKYSGDIYNLLAETGLDVGKIAYEIVKNFPSFSDVNLLNGKKVNFYKRAQIFAYDIGLLSALRVKGLSALTVFADYKVPQVLRAFEILKYKPALADKVDNYIVLDSGSSEETEIRTATIWTCELIADRAEVEPVLVDNILWKISQSLKDVRPYHRVLSTNY